MTRMPNTRLFFADLKTATPMPPLLMNHDATFFLLAITVSPNRPQPESEKAAGIGADTTVSMVSPQPDVVPQLAEEAESPSIPTRQVTSVEDARGNLVEGVTGAGLPHPAFPDVWHGLIQETGPVTSLGNYWSREISGLGHRVQMMALVIVKPYMKTNKIDRNDAKVCVLVVGFATAMTDLLTGRLCSGFG